MKKLTTTLIVVGVLTLGLAQDATIDAQIEEIQNAPLQERVKLMNQLKLRLSTMNQEDRSEAIAKMQAKMQATGAMTKAQVRERERIRKSQLEATEQILRAEHMNQKQMGSQVAHDAGSARAVRIPMH